MRTLVAVLAALALSACTTLTQEEEYEEDPRIAETHAYLESLQPPTLNYVRYPEPLRYRPINMRYAILETNAGRFLLETERLCRPLMSSTPHSDMMDERRMRGRLRARADTIRGCRIGAIYVLPPVEEPEEPVDAEPPAEETKEEP